MCDHYVFALPTAEGKAEFKSLKVDPVHGHDFNEFDVRQLLDT